VYDPWHGIRVATAGDTPQPTCVQSDRRGHNLGADRLPNGYARCMMEAMMLL
jgi:hypothetical protein